MLTAVNNNSIAKVKQDYNSIYHKAFRRSLEKHNIPQAIYYGVKYILTMKEPEKVTYETAMYKFEMIHVVTMLISMVTPAQLMQIFPVKKEFDGEKWGTKDYFFTMQAIHELGIDTPIGDKVQELLWDYQSRDLSLIMLAQLTTASDIRKMQGQKSIAEEFCEMHDIPTYTQYTDANGKEFLQNNQTGRTMKVKRKLPRYIQRVK